MGGNPGHLGDSQGELRVRWAEAGLGGTGAAEQSLGVTVQRLGGSWAMGGGRGTWEGNSWKAVRVLVCLPTFADVRGRP